MVATPMRSPAHANTHNLHTAQLRTSRTTSTTDGTAIACMRCARTRQSARAIDTKTTPHSVQATRDARSHTHTHLCRGTTRQPVAPYTHRSSPAPPAHTHTRPNHLLHPAHPLPNTAGTPLRTQCAIHTPRSWHHTHCVAQQPMAPHTHCHRSSPAPPPPHTHVQLTCCILRTHYSTCAWCCACRSMATGTVSRRPVRYQSCAVPGCGGGDDHCTAVGASCAAVCCAWNACVGHR